jgi:hypothetical protein
MTPRSGLIAARMVNHSDGYVEGDAAFLVYMSGKSTARGAPPCASTRLIT